MENRYWEWSTYKCEIDGDGWISFEDFEKKLEAPHVDLSLEFHPYRFTFMPFSISLTWGSLYISTDLAWFELWFYIQWKGIAVNEMEA